MKSLEHSKTDRLKFPKGFLWGCGTSAYQLEGGNTWCDWYEFEKEPGRIKNNDVCGKACDHYDLFKEDFALAKSLGQTSHRMGIEWSRIEKVEGEFDKKEIEHYREVLKELKRLGFTVFVTLHHFTTPTWMAAQGGWTNKKIVKKFAKFCELCATEYGDLVDFWDTINEPYVYAGQGYLVGNWVPGKRDVVGYFKCLGNMIKGHRAAFDSIKSVNQNYNVGIVYNFAFWTPANFLDRIFIKPLWDYLRDYLLVDRIRTKLDHIGVNYYFPDGFAQFPGNKHNTGVRTDQDWVIYPDGLREALVKVSKRYHIPLYITENGLADSKDDRRPKFIADHVRAVHQAIEQGADVRGYSYWSLLDFFEWADGFEPRFGLIEVDYMTQKRIPRPSAEYFAEICRTNSVENS